VKTRPLNNYKKNTNGKKTINIIIFNLGILLFLCFLCEIGLRLIGVKPYSKNHDKPKIEVTPGGKYFDTDSILGYKHRPGKYTVTLQWDYEFVTTHDDNSLRITSPIDSLKAREGKPEIWMFGCSYTHG
jgi:hypothetical protein